MTITRAPADTDFLDALHHGLSQSPKTLPCRFFYDLEGSVLFDRICEVPEYYLTRAEDEILREQAAEIVAAAPPGADLVELGSGTSRKTRRIIAALLERERSPRYVPVDISGEMLHQAAGALRTEFPRLAVDPVVGEYHEAMERLRAERERPKLVLFLGSNLGNFNPDEAVDFLRRMRGMMTPQDRALVGLDLQKDPAVLNAAYNDPQGLSARFNLNLLERANRELGTGFDLDHWEHLAFYDPREGRVEMHLVSLRRQAVSVGGRRYEFEAGERVHTENSYKFTRAQVEELAARAGFALERVWHDSCGLFSANLLAPR